MIRIPLLFSTFLLTAGGSSAACVVFACKGTYRPVLNKLLLASGVSILLWSLGLGIRVSAAGRRAALLGSFIAPIGYTMLFGFLLHYVLVLTGHKTRPDRWWIYLPVYLPGALAAAGLSILPLFGEFPLDLARTPLGWVNNTWNAWIWFYYCYYAVSLAIVFRLLYLWGKKAGPGGVRKQAWILLGSILAMAALGSPTDAVPSFLGIQAPSVAPCFAIFPILAICYGVHRLDFMQPEKFNPDEIILNKASRAKSIYIILGMYFMAGSLLNLLSQTVFFGGESVPEALLLSGLLLAGGLCIFILNRFLRDDVVKELALSFVFALFIPLITFWFFQWGSITVWIFIVLLLVPSMLFNRRIFLVTVLVSTFITQMVVIGATPEVLVQVDASDYVIRLGLIALTAFLCFFVTLVYRRRLRENAGHVLRQKVASAVSRDLLLADPDNWEEKTVLALGRCGNFFPLDQAYLALFSGEGGDIRTFCEWSRDRHPENRPEESKRRFLAAARGCLAEIPRPVLPEENASPPDREEMRTAAEALGLKGVVSAPVLRENRAVGFLCFGSARPAPELDAMTADFLKFLANMFSETLTKLDAVRKLQYIAYHDQLTGLPNRLLLTDRLKQSMPLADRRAKMIGVVFLDCDSFKTINDTMGHELGDQLLIWLAESISGCVRRYDTVARFGGDEFVLVLDKLSGTDDIIHIMEKIMRVIRRPVILQGQEFFITGSAGGTLYPQDGSDVDTLIANADIAMYHAKATGKNRFVLCSQNMKDDVIGQMKLTNLLYRAQELDQLVVYYQPQVSLEDNRITGLEALLRWNLPGEGLVSPGTFIPLAEKTGLIQPIGRWVLETACRQCRSWQEQGFAPVRVAVNVSVQQLYAGDFVAQVAEVLRATGLAPGLLELEMTESVATSGAPNISKVFAALKDLGVSLSIDDFGTEYSSLNRLTFLPVDRLKLDIQFVRGIESSEKDRAITKTIISLAKSLHMKVVAEGVETKTQLDFLSAKLCDEVQGFYYYRPMPAEDLVKYLRRFSG